MEDGFHHQVDIPSTTTTGPSLHPLLRGSLTVPAPCSPEYCPWCWFLLSHPISDLVSLPPAPLCSKSLTHPPITVPPRRWRCRLVGGSAKGPKDASLRPFQQKLICSALCWQLCACGRSKNNTPHACRHLTKSNSERHNRRLNLTHDTKTLVSPVERETSRSAHLSCLQNRCTEDARWPWWSFAWVAVRGCTAVR